MSNVRLPDEYNGAPDQELGVFTPWVPDEFDVRITKAHLNQGRESGYPYINFECEVLNGKETGNQFAGRTLFANLSFHPNMAASLKSVIHHLQIPVINGTVESDKFVGKVIGLQMDIRRDDNNKIKPDFKNFIPANSSGYPAIALEPQQQAGSANQQSDDSDIPF